MNLKLVLIGGLLFFLASWLIAPISGPLLHEGILASAYQATAASWRPELMQQPPDMAALMPRWIAAGLVGSFIIAALYGVVGNAFQGSGWMRGLKFGVLLSLVSATFMLGYSGIFNLPDQIWIWWWVEGTASSLLGGIALGWVGAKLAPRPATPAAPAAA